MSTILFACLLLAAGTCLVDLSRASPRPRGSTQERQRRDNLGYSRNAERNQHPGIPPGFNEQDSASLNNDGSNFQHGYLTRQDSRQIYNPASQDRVLSSGSQQSSSQQNGQFLLARNSHQGMSVATRRNEHTGSHHATNSAAKPSDRQSELLNTGSGHAVNTAARSTELDSTSRGNRRVQENNSGLKSQALTNTHEEADKSVNSRYQQRTTSLNNSDNQKPRENRTKLNREVLLTQNRNQSPMNSNNGLKERVYANNSANHNTRKDSSHHLQMQIPDTNTRGKRPDVSTDQRHGDGTTQLQKKTVPQPSVSSKGNTNISATRSGGEDIVFPDTNYKPRIGNAKAPACANGTTYCEKLDGYPAPYLSNVLKNEIGFKEFFGEDKPGMDLINRIGGDNDNPMCVSQEQLIFPKVGQNKDEEWLYIVNLDKDYVQGVRIELCSGDNTPCQLSDGLPPGYITSCKQKFIYRKMLAVNNDGKPAPDSFKLPSCCACFYRKVPIANRLLLETQSTQKTRR